MLRCIICHNVCVMDPERESSHDQESQSEYDPTEFERPIFTQEELAGLNPPPAQSARFRRVMVQSRRMRRAPWSNWYLVAALASGAAFYFLINMRDSREVPPSLQRYDDSSLNTWLNWERVVVRWRVEVLLLVFFLALIAGLYKGSRRAKLVRGVKSPPWIIGTLLGLFALTVGALVMWLLFHEANAVDSTERPKVRIEAIKTAASVAIGTSGVGALLLSTRRFWSGESDKLDEKFNKAVEQIGSDNPAVQVSGMVALERLAERNPEFKTSVTRLMALLTASESRRPDEVRRIAVDILYDTRHYRRPIRRIMDNDVE